MKKAEVFESYKENILPTYTRQALIFVKAKGMRIWDIDHKEYLDFFPGWGVSNLGHCHPKVMAAVRDQVGKLIHIPNNFYNLNQARLAKELMRWTFPAKVFFCNSGAEANEAAIKFSRKFGNGRYEIIAFENSFHGRTLAALAATGQEKYQQGFKPLPEGFKIVPFNDLKAVENAVTDKTVAIMLEFIQGEGGINVARKDFIAGIKEICHKKNLLLMADEVQTGIGRTAKMFAYEHYGITPDIMTLAKALGGGLPIGAMVVRKDIADILQPGTHASTFGGSPLVCKAALAVLRAVDKEKLLSKAQKAGEYLYQRLLVLKERHKSIVEIRGKGLMWGVELSVPGKAVFEKCLEKGMIINCTHDTVLRLMPALNVTKKQVDKAMAILESCL
ncbi:MAG: aspartate aminotransferase family protein [Candidatus Omnitrophota bacterium]